MWQQALFFLIAFVTGELFAIIVFRIIRNKFAAKGTPIWAAIGKGLLERFMLLLGLVMNLQSIITLFGAIKIGTRLKDSNQDKITNDYFMIGNFCSVTIALGEYFFYQFLSTT
jgi:hypothetical protein